MHPLIGVRVETNDYVDVLDVRERGSPEDVMKREVDCNAQIVEVGDRWVDDQTTAMELLSQLGARKHLA